MASNLPRGTDLFLNVVATLRRFKATWSNAAKRPVAAEAEGVAKDRIGPGGLEPRFLGSKRWPPKCALYTQPLY